MKATCFIIIHNLKIMKVDRKVGRKIKKIKLC